MAVAYIHTCYRILDPQRSADFYVNKLGLKKVGEMHLSDATNHFFAVEEDPSHPMLELTHNYGRTEPYEKGEGYAHVAFVVDDLEGTVERLRDQGVKVTLEPKTLTANGHDYRISFVEDPDGYKVELVERGTMKVGDMIQ
jgi:lactoylglutathione lyase